MNGPSLSASKSGHFNGILATRSRYSDDNRYEPGYDDDSIRSGFSSLAQLPKMISGRGVLISGMAIPKADQSDSEEEADKTTYEGGDDVEHGVDPPDSDYASYAPPNIFPIVGSERQVTQPKPVGFSLSPIKNDYTERPLKSSVGEADIKSVDDKQRRRNIWCGLAIFSVLLMGAVAVVGVVVIRHESWTTP